MCADDFNLLVKICDGDKSLASTPIRPLLEGEDWETRFRKVGDRVHACHVKNSHSPRAWPFAQRSTPARMQFLTWQA